MLPRVLLLRPARRRSVVVWAMSVSQSRTLSLMAAAGPWVPRMPARVVRARGMGSNTKRVLDEHRKRGRQSSVLEDLVKIADQDPSFLQNSGGLVKLSRSTISELRDLVARGAQTKVSMPTKEQMRMLMLQQSVPFMGFGFVDNAVMIIAGDWIDCTVGVALGLSTLAAAGLGNMVSDLFGLTLGDAIERLARRLGLPDHKMTRSQLLLPRARRASLIGSAVGLALGCLLGLLPLLFIDADRSEEDKEREILRERQQEAGNGPSGGAPATGL